MTRKIKVEYSPGLIHGNQPAVLYDVNFTLKTGDTLCDANGREVIIDFGIHVKRNPDALEKILALNGIDVIITGDIDVTQTELFYTDLLGR